MGIKGLYFVINGMYDNFDYKDLQITVAKIHLLGNLSVDI